MKAIRGATKKPYATKHFVKDIELKLTKSMAASESRMVWKFLYAVGGYAFEKLDKKIDKLESKIDALDKKFDAKIDALDDKIDQILARLPK